jgi:hypothetical protein
MVLSPNAWMLFSRFILPGSFCSRTFWGPPRFPVNPNVPLPWSRTPAGPRRLAFAALRYCPRRLDNEGSDNCLFRGSIARLWYSLSTLRAALTSDYARLASGGGQPFPGGIVAPTEFFRAVSACASPAPGLFLARPSPAFSGLSPGALDLGGTAASSGLWLPL